MTRSIPPHEDEHRAIQQLLPWFATGRLSPAEVARVQAHLAACSACSAELASEPQLHAGIGAMEPAVDAGWARVRARIDAAREPAGVDVQAECFRLQPQRRRPTWVGWAIAAQFVLFVLVSVQFAPHSSPGEYRTLAAPPAQGYRMMVMFRPETPERELRATLTGIDARLVDGPTSMNAYVIETRGGDGAAALARLRGRRAVVAAEALAPGAGG